MVEVVAARGTQPHRAAAAGRGRPSGAAAGPHRDRAGAAGQPAAGHGPRADRPELGELYAAAVPRGSAAIGGLTMAIACDPRRRSRSTPNEREDILDGAVGAGAARSCSATRSTPDDLISIFFTATPDLDRRVPGLCRPADGADRRPAAVRDRDRGARLDATGAAAAGARRHRPLPRSDIRHVYLRRRGGPADRPAAVAAALAPDVGTGSPAALRLPDVAPQRARDAAPSPVSSHSTARPAPASRPSPDGWPVALGARYLDTGAMYRAATVAVLRARASTRTTRRASSRPWRAPDRSQHRSGRDRGRARRAST